MLEIMDEMHARDAGGPRRTAHAWAGSGARDRPHCGGCRGVHSSRI